MPGRHGSSGKAYRGRLRDLIFVSGAGVTPEIIRLFLAKMPARHFHMSGKKVMESEMQWRNPKVSMGFPGISEFEIYRTDSNVIREARHILEMAWRGNM